MTLIAQFEASARRWPERTAVVDPSGEVISYGELQDRVCRLAGFLSARGVSRGDRVGVIGPKSARSLVGLLAAMKAGGAYVPADFSAPLERNLSILAGAGVKAAVLDDRNLELLARLPPGTVGVGLERSALRQGSEPGVAAWDEAVAYAPLATAPELESEDLAYILFTSGSTGMPKGVTLTHGNAKSFVDWCSETLNPTERDRFSSHAPFHFDLSVLDLYVAFKHGAAVHLVSEDLGKSPKELAAFIDQRRITVWYSTPSILTLLAEFGDLAARPMPDLRLVLFAGEVFPVKHLRRVVSLWPHPEYLNLYGPTETNVCTFARIPKPIDEQRTRPFPIGWACSHCEPLVLDDDGSEVPAGGDGLLWMSGAPVFRGYWGRPDLDANVFLERNGRRYYNTGDIVRLDPVEGYIYLGRKDRMVKRRGYRVELGEIERGLYQHPSLAEVAVISVASDTGPSIVAYLAPRPGAERPTIIAMKNHCAAHLPAYMIPDVFRFVDALPRTSTAKIDLQALAKTAQPAGKRD
jgi:amino acid adenylation domain-containing protein